LSWSFQKARGEDISTKPNYYLDRLSQRMAEKASQ